MTVSCHLLSLYLLKQKTRQVTPDWRQNILAEIYFLFSLQLKKNLQFNMEDVSLIFKIL